MSTLSLFPKEEFRVARITSIDSSRVSDDFQTFKRLLSECEPEYPGIQQWLANKVVPGLASRDRAVFVAYEGDRPAVTAVVKRARTRGRSKFCHLRVKNSYQDRHLGELFFTLMALESRGSSEIHFTLPESLWESEKRFFQGFGFRTAVVAKTQYRRGEGELACSADASVVLQAALQRVPKLARDFTIAGADLHPMLLLSLKPKHAEAVLSGQKTVEVRRRFGSHWVGSRFAIYATAPWSAVVGEATISQVVEGSPERIWARFGAALGCSEQEFKAYAAGASTVSALSLNDVVGYEPFPRAQLEYLLPSMDLRPPQSYMELTDDNPWGMAMSLVSLIRHRYFRAADQVSSSRLAAAR